MMTGLKVVSTLSSTAFHVRNMQEYNLPSYPRTKNIPKTEWGVLKCTLGAKRTAKAAHVLLKIPHIKSDWIN